MEENRCGWAKDALSIAYHDQEWGRPLHDDRALFELLILEGMQAGVSWNLILAKREAFRAAFDGFDPILVAAYGAEKRDELLQNAGIIRNRAKIGCAITNAQAFLRVQQECGSFDSYLWSFVDGEPLVNRFATAEEVPASTPLSEKLSADLRRRGFRFVGPVICYSLMQSVGMVNDHLISCPMWSRCAQGQGTQATAAHEG